MVRFILFLVIFFPIPMKAEEGFGWYSGKCWGWDYGDGRSREELEQTREVAPNQQSSYSASVQMVREEYEEALARATLEPTLENVLEVRILQQEVMERMQQFSDAWALVSLLNPELDASVTKRPISSYAIRAVEAEKTEHREALVQDFAKGSVLIYLYEGGRRMSRSMASIAQSLSQKYNWELVGLAVSGEELVDIASCPSVDVLRGFHLPLIPALLAATEEGEVLPIGWGLQSVDTLEENILRLLEHRSSR